MKTLIALLKSLLACRQPTLDESYLAASADLYDLERRMRVLDGRRFDPVFPITSHG